MEYSSMEELMTQIRDWAEEEDYNAIIKVLPELKTSERYYCEAVLCIADSYINQGFYRNAEEWLHKIEDRGKLTGGWNYLLSVALMHQMRLDEDYHAENAVKVEANYPWGMVGV